MYFYTILHSLIWVNFGFGWLNFGYFSIIQALVGVLGGTNWVSRVSLIIISMNDIGFGQLTTNINFNLNLWIILNLEWRGWGGECFICGLSSRFGEGTLASLQEIIRSAVGLLKWSSQSINYCYLCKCDITWWFIILFSYAD